MDRWESSRRKIEWAEKHIMQLYLMFRNFSETDFYTLRVEEDPEELTHSLHFDLNLSGLNFENAALIIGDALHNLRSALDHLYYQVVLACEGEATTWTRFPIFDSREQLDAWAKGALEKQQITKTVRDFIVDIVKPYQAGNPTLWGLHQLNILDKHEMIVPVLQLVGFFGVRLEDEDGNQVGLSDYIAEKSQVLRITGSYRQKVKLKDKGRASANVIFNIGATGFAGQTVFPALKDISEEVSRTVNAFSQIDF